jgi:hypothetical protein
MEIVASAHMSAIDEDLGYGGAPTASVDHLGTQFWVGIDAEHDRLDALVTQQMFCRHAIRASRAPVHHHLGRLSGCLLGMFWMRLIGHDGQDNRFS